MARLVMLDREQRDLLRRLVHLDGQGMADDVAAGFVDRDRRATVEAVGRLQAMVALMDAIGWTGDEDDDLPRPVALGDAVVGWAVSELVAVREWLPAAVEAGERDLDDELAALDVLVQVAGTAA